MVASFCFELAASRQAEIGFQRASEHRNFALVSRYVASSANYEILSRTCWLVWMLTAWFLKKRFASNNYACRPCSTISKWKKNRSNRFSCFQIISHISFLLSGKYLHLFDSSLSNPNKKIQVHCECIEILIDKQVANIFFYKIYKSNK